jgi:hypothetical protein
MDAGNVASMRVIADLLERRVDSRQALQLRAEAKELALMDQSCTNPWRLQEAMPSWPGS